MNALIIKPSVVLQLIARMILVLVFVAGTFHTPVAAHEGSTGHHAAQGAVAAHDLFSDHHEAPPSSPDDVGDNVHHHHCPTAVAARAVDIAAHIVPAKDNLPFDRAAALSSLSQAPPTHPPSA
jgi:hypothetical protein